MLVTPLSVGSHTIHVTRAFPSRQYAVTYTYHLIVQPAALTAMTTRQGGHLLISWPQMPDAYLLDTCSDLDSPAWQPATNLSVVLSNGTYQATSTIGATNRFFRLRLN